MYSLFLSSCRSSLTMLRVYTPTPPFSSIERSMIPMRMYFQSPRKDRSLGFSVLLHLRVDDQPVTNGEIVEFALLEGTQCVLGSTNDRLPVHVETGIDQRGNPGELMI